MKPAMQDFVSPLTPFLLVTLLLILAHPFLPPPPSSIHSSSYHHHHHHCHHHYRYNQVKENADVLRQFCLTGTVSTMKMLRSVLGEDVYGARIKNKGSWCRLNKCVFADAHLL
jgi:hypothetical protein